MKSLLDSLLELAQIGVQPPQRNKINMSKLVEEVIEELQAIDPSHSVEVSIEPSITVRADSKLLYALLNNLLGNAWKYSSNEECPRIEFGQVKNLDEIVSDCQLSKAYYIKDNGIGFSNDETKNIFNPFVRLPEALDFKGDGIGLSIADRIVRQHGGVIIPVGEPSKGAIFYFSLGE